MFHNQGGWSWDRDQMNKHQQESKLRGEQVDRADEYCDAGGDIFHEGAREEKPAQLLF